MRSAAHNIRLRARCTNNGLCSRSGCAIAGVPKVRRSAVELNSCFHRVRQMIPDPFFYPTADADGAARHPHEKWYTHIMPRKKQKPKKAKPGPKPDTLKIEGQLAGRREEVV